MCVLYYSTAICVSSTAMCVCSTAICVSSYNITSRQCRHKNVHANHEGIALVVLELDFVGPAGSLVSVAGQGVKKLSLVSEWFR